MDKFWGMTATAWTAIYTLLTLGLLAVAVTAALYARNQWQESKKANQDALDAAREAARPYIVVTIEPSRVGMQIMDLVVRNIGARPATDIRVALDPPPIRADETRGHEIAKAKMLTEPIAPLAPGQELRTFYDATAERAGRDDLPSVHAAHLTYRDRGGNTYEEDSVVDFNALMGTLHTTTYTMHDLAKAVREIQKRLDTAGILERNPDLAAVVEGHAEREQRVANERAEMLADYHELVSKLRPEQPTPPSESAPE